MTKQEEIRKWLEHNFHETNARVILDYLHSQGVVIKYDRLTVINSDGKEHYRERIEPLIEDVYIQE